MQHKTELLFFSNSVMSNFDDIRSDNAFSGVSVKLENDNEEEGRTDDYITFTIKEDSNFVMNNNSVVDTEEQNELRDGGITVELTAKHLEFQKNIWGSSGTLTTDEMFQELQDRKVDDIVKDECEILIVKSEKDEVLSVKKENICDEGNGNNGCKIVSVSEVSSVVGGVITEETADLLRRYHESTTNNQNYLNDSDFDVNTNITEHKVFSVNNESDNHEEERTNNSSSSPLEDNEAYIVSRNAINDADTDSIIKVEHELETFKTEDEEEDPGKKFSCNVCVFSTAHKNALTVHLRTHTTSDFICHKRNHTGEKPFLCKVCEFSCAQKGNLLQHMRVHTGQKRYRCTDCDYATTSSSYLINHKRTHTGEKPFLCNVCGFRTSTKNNLTNHMRIHTGEKLYRCSDCNYASTKKALLINHKRIHTGE